MLLLAIWKAARQAAAVAPPVNVFLRLLPLTLAVFVGFLTIGLPLPVLPLHLSQHRGGERWASTSAGLIASNAGVSAVCLVGAAVVALSSGVALHLRLRSASGTLHA